MTYLHEDSEFDALLRIVAEQRGIAVALVEKDYWVTHVLWALHDQGFDIWFKGGTSLSKGFALIQRFSEDLDLKVEPGGVQGLPSVELWKSTTPRNIQIRREYFQALVGILAVPGATASLDTDASDDRWRFASIIVQYAGRHVARLPQDMKPFVLLEVGHARVTPFVGCDLSSFVHDALDQQGQALSFLENRPKAVRCVHPLVTLIDKLDALIHKTASSKAEPATFVRHYEDAAHIIRAAPDLPPLEGFAAPRELLQAMSRGKDVRRPPSADDPAFRVKGHPREDAIRAASERIHHVFWGPRITLDEACDEIRAWVDSELA